MPMLIFFIILVLLGSFYMFNLVLAVVARSYFETSRELELEKEQKLREAEKAAVRTARDSKASRLSNSSIGFLQRISRVSSS